VQVDCAVEDPVDDVAAHAATSKVCSPYPMIRWA
ncbi:MAG: hypothetical protein V7644_289, partial [Actinomycetota bacterium]